MLTSSLKSSTVILRSLTLGARMVFSCVFVSSCCCVCSGISRCFWNWISKQAKRCFSVPQATRSASSSLTSFRSAANSMSVADSVKQAIGWIGMCYVNMELSAMSGKIGRHWRRRHWKLNLHWVSVMAEDAWGRNKTGAIPAKKRFFLLPKAG